MKKTKNKKRLIIALCALFFATLSLFSSAKVTYAYDDYGDYRFELTTMDVRYDLRSDCTATVTELFAVHYLGKDSTGIYRDIPINGGLRIEKVNAWEIIGGQQTELDYTIENQDSSFLTLSLGDYSNKTNELHIYKVQYDYIMYHRDGLLPINAVGVGWDCVISDVSVTINLPDGFIGEKSKCYVGEVYTAREYPYTYAANKITFTINRLEKYNGISFDLQFEEGALTTTADILPWLFVFVLAALLIVLILIKGIFFPSTEFIPVVSYNPPKNLDPLQVGYYIDGSVENEDITSLIYYWANLGYLRINVQNEKDPILTKLVAQLPSGSPPYQVDMFNSLFAWGTSVQVSSLAEKFYPTIDRVRTSVGKDRKLLYTKKSLGLSALFSLLSAVIGVAIPILLTLIRVSTKTFPITSFLMIVPPVVLNSLTQAVYYAKLRRKPSTTNIMYGGITLLGAVFTLVYCFIMPYAFFETGPKIAMCILCVVIPMLSVSLITPTPEYVKRLNGILGFKSFIELAKTDELELMLESNPNLYYNVLPYAQVLGITDIWEKKFAALAIKPPDWVDGATSYALINARLRSSMYSMSANMNSRPQKSSSSFGGGGSFGGGVGGGFGGGGGRGR